MTAGEVIQVPVEEIRVPEGMKIPKSGPGLLNIFSKQGITKPLVISPDRVLLDGIKRLTAARALQMETVPCVIRRPGEEAPPPPPAGKAGGRPHTVRAKAPGGWCSWTRPGTTLCRRRECVDADGHRCLHYGGGSR